MVWVLIGAVIWVALAVPTAVLIGRAIRLADQRSGPRTRCASVRRPRSWVVRHPVGAAERNPAARDSGLA